MSPLEVAAAAAAAALPLGALRNGFLMPCPPFTNSIELK